MTDDLGHSENPVSDEMSAYLQMFLDETEEQLEGLVETLLVLEREPHRVEELNEAFRLIHTIKGSAGMMGFENIAVLTHHLETRFEAFRSGLQTLDRPTMNLVLRCIDFLRECTGRLRAGEALGSAADLLRELTQQDDDDASGTRGASVAARPETAPSEAAAPEPVAEPSSSPGPGSPADHDDALRVVVVFEPGLPLADLKARLIVSRLSALGDIASTTPPVGALEGVETLDRFEVVLATAHDADTIRETVDLDGVQSVELRDAAAGAMEQEETADPPSRGGEEPLVSSDVDASAPDERGNADGSAVDGVIDETGEIGPPPSPPPPAAIPTEPAVAPPPTGDSSLASPGAPPAERARPKVTGTIRVDIDRLDRLMNLAGELVVNRARFVQVTSQVGGSLRARNAIGRVRDLGETLRKTIVQLQNAPDTDGDRTAQIEELKAGLDFLEEQSEVWANGRRCFVQIGEAIDQLTRIADSLQQGVLDTRMVPVAPLFNRFNRVVRDLSIERGKQVHLEIHGEKTELDKRMIDELGDPLVHLVRNSIDHGLEPPEVRRARGKPETGTIRLEASHRGNSVYVSIRDDGGGIDVARVREKIIERELLSATAAAQLSDDEALEFIWHAGFSTAAAVTNISGRGVGMDVVRTRIDDLNGTVDVESTPEVGTTFTIRLPLTLAIINSLLIRIRDVIFSMPIDDVREIVSVPVADIVSVGGKHTIDVRGEFVPLIGINDVFDWNEVGRGNAGRDDVGRGNVANGHAAPTASEATPLNGGAVAAVVLQVGGRTMGLRVDELLGSQDIVIKSLSENFIPIRGLSGASVLGDGTVCLMLDVGALIDMAIKSTRTSGRMKERKP